MKKKRWMVYPIILLFAGLYVFVETPSLNPLIWEGALFWAVLITVLVGVWALLKVGELSFVGFDASRGGQPFRYVSNARFPRIAMVLIGAPWVFIAGMVLFGSVFFQWKAYRDQLGEATVKDFDSEIQAVDLSQIPIVDEDLALQLAKKKLGERPALGSQVEIHNATIQMVDGELVWAVPLYHSGFFKWLTNLEGTPGYVVVSATNTNDVRYVEGSKIKYHPGSYLLFDVERKIRFNGGLFSGITDFSFELDDQGQAYWVASTYSNLKGFSLPEADGIIVLNATTGETGRYPLEEVPQWVDRVQPEEFVLRQIYNQGQYVHGIFNFANKDKYMPSEGHNIVYNNGRCYLFTGLTSVGADDSSIGFVMVDMVTKETLLYEMSGATEEAATRSAEGKVQDLKYTATFPVILNIEGQPTYFMTLKDGIGLIKQYAFVSVTNYSTVGTGESIQAALRDYETRLREDGVGANLSTQGQDEMEITGTVLRVAAEPSGGIAVYKMILREAPDQIFVLDGALSDELALTQPGDRVSIRYPESANGIQQGNEFDNLEFYQGAGSGSPAPETESPGSPAPEQEAA